MSRRVLGILKSPKNTYKLTEKGTLVGRSQSASIIIQHHSISKDHALIEFDESSSNPILRDLNSMNGTFVNDRKIINGQTIPLRNGDTLAFGNDSEPYTFEVGAHSSSMVDSSCMGEKRINLVGDAQTRYAQRDHLAYPSVAGHVPSNTDPNTLPGSMSTTLRSATPTARGEPARIPRSIPREGLKKMEENVLSPISDVNLYSYEEKSISGEKRPWTSSEHRRPEMSRNFSFAPEAKPSTPKERAARTYTGIMESSPEQRAATPEEYTQKTETNPQFTGELLDNYKRMHENEKVLLEQIHEKNMEDMQNRASFEIAGIKHVHQKDVEEMQTIAQRLLGMEEKFLILDKDKRQILNELDQVKEEYGKTMAKNSIIELYASELQKKLDNATMALREKEEKLERLETEDWSKKIMESNNMVQELRGELEYRENEYTELKLQISNTIKAASTGTLNFKKHYEAFIEQQSKELIRSKKIITEYESRENNCMKKWNSLLQENLKHGEKINGLKQQLLRQKETYQNLLASSDRKLAELNAAFPLLMQDVDPKKKAAAEFLVDQMNGLNQDKLVMLSENENLHIRIQELIEENETLHHELAHLHPNPQSESFQGNEESCLRNRIDELEDLISEVKQQGSVTKIVELQGINKTLHLELSKKDIKIKEIHNEIHRVIESNKGVVINGKDAVDYYSLLLKEKEEQLVNIRNERDIIQGLKQF